jgi:putative PIN family toxin of toxin-antitoxin system
MIKVVPDTNVLVSGLFWQGPARRILDLARAGRVRLVTCTAAERELVRVLAYPKLGLDGPACVRIVQALHPLLDLVEPAGACTRIVQDPADNVFLACAAAARADAVVSGDHHLLDLREHEGMPILNPAQFLERFAEPLR